MSEYYQARSVILVHIECAQVFSSFRILPARYNKKITWIMKGWEQLIHGWGSHCTDIDTRYSKGLV